MGGIGVRVLLFDANVLIDYIDAEPTVFASIRDAVGELCVVSTVLAEVEQLDEVQAVELGLRVIEPDIEILAAAAERRGRLSFQDRVCLAVACEEGMSRGTSLSSTQRSVGSEHEASTRKKRPSGLFPFLPTWSTATGRAPGVEELVIHRSRPRSLQARASGLSGVGSTRAEQDRLGFLRKTRGTQPKKQPHSRWRPRRRELAGRQGPDPIRCSCHRLARRDRFQHRRSHR